MHDICEKKIPTHNPPGNPPHFLWRRCISNPSYLFHKTVCSGTKTKWLFSISNSISSSIAVSVYSTTQCIVYGVFRHVCTFLAFPLFFTPRIFFVEWVGLDNNKLYSRNRAWHLFYFHLSCGERISKKIRLLLVCFALKSLLVGRVLFRCHILSAYLVPEACIT
jgi:hypothetical protein